MTDKLMTINEFKAMTTRYKKEIRVLPPSEARVALIRMARAELTEVRKHSSAWVIKAIPEFQEWLNTKEVSEPVKSQYAFRDDCVAFAKELEEYYEKMKDSERAPAKNIPRMRARISSKKRILREQMKFITNREAEAYCATEYACFLLRAANTLKSVIERAAVPSISTFKRAVMEARALHIKDTLDVRPYTDKVYKEQKSLLLGKLEDLIERGECTESDAVIVKAEFKNWYRVYRYSCVIQLPL